MEAARAGTPVPSALTQALDLGAPRRPAGGLVGAALMHLAGGVGLLAACAAAYTEKRRLGIDVFPGVDVLPDPQIEAAIAAAVRLLGWR